MKFLSSRNTVFVRPLSARPRLRWIGTAAIASAAMLWSPNQALALSMPGEQLVVRAGSALEVTRVTVQPENGGVRISGDVRRNLGLGAAGSVSIQVSRISPQGVVTFSKPARLDFPNRRPIRLSRDGTFTLFLPSHS